MALVINDRVKETSTTTGTGTFDLAGASQDFISFVSGVGNTNTTYYCIANTGTDEFEVGVGTVTDAATDTLSRDTVISNNLGTAKSILAVVPKLLLMTVFLDRVSVAASVTVPTPTSNSSVPVFAIQ